MIPLLAIGVPIVIALLFWWLSAATDRRNQRSMQRYGSALDVLGDVSRRSESSAPVPLPAPDEIARVHIGFAPVDGDREEPVEESPPRPRVAPPGSLDGEPLRIPLFDDLPAQRESSAGFHDANATAAALGRMVARSRFNREYGVSPEDPGATGSDAHLPLSPPSGELLRFGSNDITTFDNEPVGDVEDLEPRWRRLVGSVRGRALRVGPPKGARRRQQIAAAAVALVLVLGGVLYVTLRQSPVPSAGQASPTQPAPRHSGGASSSPVSTVLPTVFKPVSATKTLVTYLVPRTKYTLAFSATAACWLGAEHRVNGNYLWMDTLTTGSSTSYLASGTRVIRLGAPRALSITLDGVPIALPKSFVVPYDIKLEVSTS